MTTPPSQQPPLEPGDAVDRYLDQLMSPPERAEFERRLAQDPELAAHIHRQQQVDTVLRQYGRAPSADRVLRGIREHIAALPAADAPVQPPQFRIGPTPAWRRLAFAAVLVLGLIGVWQVALVLTAGPTGKYETGPHRTMIQAYRDTVDGGFKASWVCDNDAVFAMVFKDTFGQMLSMNLPLPAQTKANGLNYFDIFSEKTVGMLGEVSGQPVMIFIDRLKNDEGNQPSVQDGLHVFRRSLGTLVLYEVTPLDQPGLLNHLVIPERLPDGTGPNPPEP